MTGPGTELEGLEVGSVCFVRNYVELVFDGPILRSLAEPVVRIDGRTWHFPEEGARDALCRLIGRTVGEFVDAADRLEVVFEDGASFLVPKAAPGAGPEVAHFVPMDASGSRLDVGQMMIWENVLPTR